MPEKDIETQLKDGADKITVKSFSERWDNIKDRLSDDGANQTVLVESPVLATSVNSAVKSADSRKIRFLIAALSFAVCIIIVLAIVLPITLRNKEIDYKEPAYSDPSDLLIEIVNEDTFFDNLEKSKISIVNIDGYQCEDYSMLITDTGDIKGGCFTINDEDNLMIIDVIFYSSSVNVPENEFINSPKYIVGEAKISYQRIKENTELIQYKALAKYNNVTYQLNYYSLTDKLLEFFDRFFS